MVWGLLLNGVNEGIKVSLEPLHAQIVALIEMIDRLIQSNSAKETITASSRGILHRYELPYSEAGNHLASRR